MKIRYVHSDELVFTLIDRQVDIPRRTGSGEVVIDTDNRQYIIQAENCISGEISAYVTGTVPLISALWDKFYNPFILFTSFVQKNIPEEATKVEIMEKSQTTEYSATDQDFVQN